MGGGGMSGTWRPAPLFDCIKPIVCVTLGEKRAQEIVLMKQSLLEIQILD